MPQNPILHTYNFPNPNSDTPAYAVEAESLAAALAQPTPVAAPAPDVALAPPVVSTPAPTVTPQPPSAPTPADNTQKESN